MISSVIYRLVDKYNLNLKMTIVKDRNLKEICMRLIRNLIMLCVAVTVAASVSACKPSYEVQKVDPIMTTAPADQPYELDFIQLNNDVIDSLSMKKDIFPFIKSVDINGDNDKKSIELNMDIQSGVSDEAVQVLIADVTKRIANNAYIQDFRLKKADYTQFGSVFDIYSYTYKVTCGDETLYDETISAGDDIPLDPSMDGDAVEEALDQINSTGAESSSETESN